MININPPIFSKTLKKAQAEFNKIHNFLIRDPIVKETLFTADSIWYSVLRYTNVVLSFIILIPLVDSIIKLNIPRILTYLFCGFGIYLSWVFEWVTKSPILEEIRTFTIIQINLHAFVGGWLGFYDKFEIYDFILHVTGGMWLVFLIFPLIIGIELISTDSKSPFFYLKIVVITIAIVTTLGVFWEIIEFTSDLMFHNYPGYRLAQVNNFDTMTDIVANLIGAIAGMEIFWLTLKKLNKSRDMDLLFERMGKALKDYINHKN